MVKTLFPESRNLDVQRRQANIIYRAERLITEGYTLVRRSRPTLWGVYKPGNTRPAVGIWHSDYVVALAPGAELCTCKGFRADGDCKHRIAVALEMEAEAADLAIVEEFERARANAGVPECLLPDNYPF